MDFANIVITVLVMAILGLLLGFLVAIAGKVFYVRRDERVEKIKELLPDANCGGCGCAGCEEYARAIVREGEQTNKCSVGGDRTAAQIAQIMGTPVKKTVRMRAQVMCSGTNRLASRKYNYEGLKDCLSVARLGNGPKECLYGCIGLGTCVKACHFGAIKVESGVAVVEHEKCRACGMCVSACPQNIIKLIPYDTDVWVGCSNQGKGRDVRTVCKVGCTSCGICAKSCPSEAISIEDGIAVIDYSKCVNCGLCVEKCPRKIIRSGKDQISNGATITSAPVEVVAPKAEIHVSERLFTEDAPEFRSGTTEPVDSLEIGTVNEDDNQTQT